MTIREKMHNTELYLPTDPEIMKEQQGYMNLLYDFNHTRLQNRIKEKHC